MKKILTLIMFVSLIFSYVTFAYSNIETKINSIFIKIENKKKLDSCDKKQRFYNKLGTKLDSIQNKKYGNLVLVMKKVIQKRLYTCILKDKNSDILYFQLDKKLIVPKNFRHYKFPALPSTKVPKLNSISKITDIYDNYYKVDGKWITFKKVIYYTFNTISKSKIDNLRKRYKNYYIFLYDNVVYLAEYDDIVYIPYDVKKTLQEQNLPIPYIKHLYALKANKIPVYGLGNYKNHLFVFVFSNTVNYHILDDEKMYYYYLSKIPSNNAIILENNGKKYLIMCKNRCYYDIGNMVLYKNINLDRLGKLLFNTFYLISKLNMKYKEYYMYKLLKYAAKFDGKTIKYLYQDIIKNISYNPQIQKLIYSSISQDKLNNLVNNPKVGKIWSVFHIFRYKNGVCQNISELFSLVALFNGKDADIIEGTVNLQHQLSKIGNYYYDPTFDIDSTSMKHFKMTEKTLKKYFIIKK